MTRLTGVGGDESDLLDDLREALTEMLGEHLGQINGSVFRTEDDHSIPLLVMEYKRAIGEGGCDALTQASHSAWKCWRENNVCALDFYV
jgi:hypothetical protein